MLIDSEDRARRLARTIVSDIALYNRDLIRRGIQEDNIFDLLAEDIDKGRKLYEGRVMPEILGRSNFYNHAIVDIIIRQYGTIESKIW